MWILPRKSRKEKRTSLLHIESWKSGIIFSVYKWVEVVIHLKMIRTPYVYFICLFEEQVCVFSFSLYMSETISILAIIVAFISSISLVNSQ